MGIRVRWAPRAARHFEQICEYIAQDSNFFAKIFAEKVLNLVENIPSFPKSGRIVPEYNDKNLREKIYGDYRIVYRIKEDIIEIAAITHGCQLIKNI